MNFNKGIKGINMKHVLSAFIMLVFSLSINAQKFIDFECMSCEIINEGNNKSSYQGELFTGLKVTGSKTGALVEYIEYPFDIKFFKRSVQINDKLYPYSRIPGVRNSSDFFENYITCFKTQDTDTNTYELIDTITQQTVGNTTTYTVTVEDENGGTSQFQFTDTDIPYLDIDVEVIGFTIVGDIATLTLSNGQTFVQNIIHPVDVDTIVTGFSIIGDVVTLTLSSGQTFTQNIVHPTDLDTILTGFTIVGDQATITLSSGQTFTQTITHPTDVDTVLTDFTIVGDVATIKLSSGQTFTANITHPTDVDTVYQVIDGGEGIDVTRITAGNVVEYIVNINESEIDLFDIDTSELKQLIRDCVPASSETSLTITTDGNSNGVNLSGTANHTANITILSTDADNDLETRPDGGVYYNDEDITFNVQPSSDGLDSLTVYNPDGSVAYTLKDTNVSDSKICQTVADNCNASLTSFVPILDGTDTIGYNVAFQDNAGVTVTRGFQLPEDVDFDSVETEYIVSAGDTTGYITKYLLSDNTEIDRDTFIVPSGPETRVVNIDLDYDIDNPPIAPNTTPTGCYEDDLLIEKFNCGTVIYWTLNADCSVKSSVVDNACDCVRDTINLAIDGQSNSIGQQAGSTKDIKELCNIEVWNGSVWVFPVLGQAPFNANGADNMALRFAEKMAIENPCSRIRLVQVGNNGQPITHWVNPPNTGLFDLLNTLNASGIGELDALIWMQGESDNGNVSYQTQYEALLTNLYSFPQISGLTKILNVGLYTGAGATLDGKDVDLREIGMNSNEYTSYVNSANLGSYDNLHYTNDAMCELGYERIYSTYLNTPYVEGVEARDTTPWRLAGAGGITKTNSWTDEISHDGGIRILNDFDLPNLAAVIVNPDSRGYALLASGEASTAMIETQQTHSSAPGIFINQFPVGQSGIGLRIRSRLGQAILAEKAEANSTSWKLNNHSIFRQGALTPPVDGFGGYINFTSLADGSTTTFNPLGLLGWYWEDVAAVNGPANISISSNGSGMVSDDHLSIVGARPYKNDPDVKGVEINSWLKIGDFDTTDGTITNPEATLDIETLSSASNTKAIDVENFTGDKIFIVRDDGVIEFNPNLAALPPAPTTGAGICFFAGDYYRWQGGAWVLDN